MSFGRPARAFSTIGNALRSPRSPHSVDLPPEKMRALIAMYHQSESFVTRENLDAKIDEAFTMPRDRLVKDATGLSMGQFWGLLRTRHDAPKVTEWNREAKYDPPAVGAAQLEGEGRLWSNAQVPRDTKVIEALYGVETLGTEQALPGLEVLEDEADLIETSVKEDRARYDQSDF